MERPGFRWGGYRGVRVMYDQDAYQNFSHVAGTRFLGRWPEVVRRNDFSVVLCTGAAVRDNLVAAGLRAVWMPKAADQTRFFPIGGSREGLCYFGERYAARAAMLDHLSRRNVPVTTFRCSYFELNQHLNRFLACLICNMEAKVASTLGRLVNRLSPSRGIVLGPAPEAMLKNFEVAAAGCVPMCDHIDELETLGFRDGETAVTYRTFDELAEKAMHYRQRPELLVDIGRRAAELVRARHTWDHRADQLASLIATERAANADVT